MKLRFKITFAILLMLAFFSNISYSQQILSFDQVTQIESGKKKKIVKDISEWVSNQSSYAIKQSFKNDTLILESYFNFVNTVKLDESDNLSRVYASQTNGRINYKLYFIIKENQLIVSVRDFNHVSLAKGEKISFGKLTTDEDANAPFLADYDSSWRNNVWSLMKRLAQENATKALELFPSSLLSQN